MSEKNTLRQVRHGDLYWLKQIMETTFNMSLTPDYRQMHEFLTERLDTLSQDDYNKKW